MKSFRKFTVGTQVRHDFEVEVKGYQASQRSGTNCDIIHEQMAILCSYLVLTLSTGSTTYQELTRSKGQISRSQGYNSWRLLGRRSRSTSLRDKMWHNSWTPFQRSTLQDLTALKKKARWICAAPHCEKLASEALRYGSHSCYTANTPYLPLRHKHSRDGATTV